MLCVQLTCHNRNTYIFYSFFPRILGNLLLIDFFQDLLIHVSVLIYRALCETAGQPNTALQPLDLLRVMESAPGVVLSPAPEGDFGKQKKHVHRCFPVLCSSV